MAASGLVVAWVLAVAGPMSAVDEPSKKPTKFQYDSNARRDPFVPLVRDGRFVGTTSGTHGETSKPVLYGILWDPGGHSLALINDVEVGVGQAVGTYQVAEIRRDAVVLTDGGQSIVLEINFEVPTAPPEATKGR